MTDSVVDAARRGDEAAWRVLYEDLAPAVGGYFRARRMTDPEDLVSEVFMDMARRIGSFEGSMEGFRGWAFAIAHSRYVDAVRALERRPVEPIDGMTDPVGSTNVEGEVLAALQRDTLLAAADALSPGQRSVLLLRVFGDLSVAETAKALGKTPTAVKVTLHRAVKGLERELTGHRPFPGPGVGPVVEETVGGVTK